MRIRNRAPLPGVRSGPVSRDVRILGPGCKLLSETLEARSALSDSSRRKQMRVGAYDEAGLKDPPSEFNKERNCPMSEAEPGLQLHDASGQSALCYSELRIAGFAVETDDVPGKCIVAVVEVRIQIQLVEHIKEVGAKLESGVLAENG